MHPFDRAGSFLLALEQGLQPDLVLLDLGLPDLSGHKVLEQLRRSPGPQPAVLVISAWRQPGLTSEQVQGFIGKPFELGGVLAAVQALLPTSPGQQPPQVPTTKAPLARLSLSLPEYGSVVQAIVTGFQGGDQQLADLRIDASLAAGLGPLAPEEWQALIRRYLSELQNLLESPTLRVSVSGEGPQAPPDKTTP